MDIDFKHTWRIPRTAWYIRFYLWLWEAEESDITFCKLFWAYALIGAGLPLKALVGIHRGIRKVGRHQGVVIKDYKPSKPKKVQCRLCKKGRPHIRHFYWACSERSECGHGPSGYSPGNYHPPSCRITQSAYKLVYDDALLVESTPPSWMMRCLTKFTDRVSQLNMWFKRPRPRLAWVCKWTMVLLMVASIVGMILGLVLAIVAHPQDALAVVKWGGLGITALTMVAGVIYIVIASGLVLAFHRVVLRDFFGRNSKTVGLGFGRVMLIGYKAVKSNTCPRVEIEE